MIWLKYKFIIQARSCDQKVFLKKKHTMHNYNSQNSKSQVKKIKPKNYHIRA